MGSNQVRLVPAFTRGWSTFILTIENGWKGKFGNMLGEAELRTRSFESLSHLVR